jgi:hypothetical protein
VQARPRLAEAIALRREAAEPERLGRRLAQRDGAGLDAELATSTTASSCDVTWTPRPVAQTSRMARAADR